MISRNEINDKQLREIKVLRQHSVIAFLLIADPVQGVEMLDLSADSVIDPENPGEITVPAAKSGPR